MAVSGQVVPYTEDFPQGFAGHLRVVLKIWGDDLWRVGTIDSSVVEGTMQFVPGTIDSWRWVETRPILRREYGSANKPKLAPLGREARIGLVCMRRRPGAKGFG